jgi:membrane-associated protein
MEFIQSFLHFALHLNEALPDLLCDYGIWFYVILFAIIFAETGLVIFPFLPGDSLLFAAGALAAKSSPCGEAINPIYLILFLILAAILGDQTNYFIGRFFGHKILNKKFRGKPLVSEKNLKKTHDFFEKFGTKAIIMARFVPIIRTITPFVAGVGEMSYRKKFLPYDLFGGALWISSMTAAGYFLGRIPFVEKHFEAVVVGIIVLSLAPMIVAFIKSRRKPRL